MKHVTNPCSEIYLPLRAPHGLTVVVRDMSLMLNWGSVPEAIHYVVEISRPNRPARRFMTRRLYLKVNTFGWEVAPYVAKIFAVSREANHSPAASISFFRWSEAETSAAVPDLSGISGFGRF